MSLRRTRRPKQGVRDIADVMCLGNGALNEANEAVSQPVIKFRNVPCLVRDVRAWEQERAQQIRAGVRHAVEHRQPGVEPSDYFCVQGKGKFNVEGTIADDRGTEFVSFCTERA